MFFMRSLVTALFAVVATARVLPQWHEPTSINLTQRTVYELNLGIWPENLLVRSNGNILLSILYPAAELWQIDPFKPDSKEVIFRWPNATTAWAIVEVEDDLYYVSVGNYTVMPTLEGHRNTYAIYEVDFRGGRSLPSVTETVRIPDALAIDGMATLNHKAGLLLGGDAYYGQVYLIDTVKRTAKVVFEDPLLNTSSFIPGINGMKVYDDYLYFTNSDQQFFGRIQVDVNTGAAIGPIERLLETPGGIDDFILDRKGDFYGTRAGMGVAYSQSPGYHNITVFGNMTGATAAAFGRTKKDHDVLYVTSSGGPGEYISGNITKPGDLSSLDFSQVLRQGPWQGHNGGRL